MPKALKHQSKAMKRIGNLYDKVISMDNLKLADEKARKGKHRNYGVGVFDQDRDRNLEKLQESLRNNTYKTSHYDVFTIFEPKERIIYRLPYYPDRIVRHAIMNILEPIWVKTFTHNTFSCIKKRGIEGCARYVGKLIRRYKGKSLYCLKIDIRKYYPSIDHDVMKKIIRKKIKDKRLLILLDEIIDSAKGLPIGNYISQYLANLYLAYFMHKVCEVYKIDAAEYADDIIFLAESKDILHNLLRDIRNDIEEKLNINIKDNYQIFPIAMNRYDKHGRALDYVGYKFFREQKLLRKIARLNRIKPCLDASSYKQAIAPWLGWAKHSDSKHLLQTVLKPINYDSIL